MSNLKMIAPLRIDISSGWPDSDPFRAEYGGVVFNAAINKYAAGELGPEGMNLYLVDAPPNSGLGTSGALRSVYLGLSNPSLLLGRKEMIARVHALENVVLGQRAGFQDEAAAIFGGINLWTFGKSGEIEREPLSNNSIAHLQDRLTIVYTGKPHLSADLHAQVFGDKIYQKNIPSLERMKDIAVKMFQDASNEAAFSELMNESWELQKRLHPSIETDEMRKIQRERKGHYLSCKALGAGGGGFMLFHGADFGEEVKFEMEGIREPKDSSEDNLFPNAK